MTGAAEFTEFQPILMQFLVFCRRVVSIFANRTFQRYDFAHKFYAYLVNAKKTSLSIPYIAAAYSSGPINRAATGVFQ